VVPEFTVQPAPVAVYVGRPARFAVVAEGSAPIRYQWTVNGVALAGQTNATVVLNGLAGSYEVRCVAANGVGGVTSDKAALQIAALPSSCDLRSNLVVHLEFESSWTDTSGRGNHAAPVGSPTWIGGPIGLAALHYRTDSHAIPKVFDYATLGKLSDLLFSTNVDFTVSFWTRFTGLPAALPFFANSDNGLGDGGLTLAASPQTGGWAWSLNDAAQPRAWGGVGAVSPGRDVLNDNHWHHLAFTFERGSNAVTYLDGQPVAVASLRPAVGWNLDGGNPMNIGQASGTYPADGEFDLDDLGVWRRALTPFEVDTMYLAGTLVRAPLAPDLNTQIRLEIDRVGSQVRIVWNSTGTLYSALRATGPWTVNTNATSPFLVTPSGTSRFFRVRQ
jgi:hypothetical protein